MKNTKKIVAVIMMATIICSIFVACSRGNEREKENAVNNTVSVENNTQDITENKDKENSTEKVTDDATESASKSDEQKNENQTVTNQQKETTTTKKVTTTAKKQVETTKAAQKNVSPKDVQKQVNAYIKSKGATLDAVNAYGIHMTPDSASWSGRISRLPEYLNDGTTLKTCKGYVDAEIAHGAKYLYCYYDSNWFYVLWLD